MTFGMPSPFTGYCSGMEGADLNAKLPFLVAYLGHKDFTGTQKYLHLTAELFPNLTARMNQQFGGVIPQGRWS